jgi:hypothetical protein
VPEIAPEELKARPAGSAPEAKDHEYGAVPPMAARVCEYDTVATASCTDTVLMARLGPTTMESSFSAVLAALPSLLTWTVKLYDPTAVAIPEIWPAVFSARPGGSEEPDASDHTYGLVPPLVTRV